MTEQGAFLDGFDDNGRRAIIDKLSAYLQR